jgi:hypothetical protein
MSEFLIQVRAVGTGPAAEVRLKRLLKTMLRRFGLRCTDVRQVPPRPARGRR